MMKYLVLSLLFISPVLQAETNYCHDQETNKVWEQIKRNHRGEKDVEALYTLRVQLCRQVDAGTMTVREATEWFEAKRKEYRKNKRPFLSTRKVLLGE